MEEKYLFVDVSRNWVLIELPDDRLSWEVYNVYDEAFNDIPFLEKDKSICDAIHKYHKDKHRVYYMNSRKIIIYYNDRYIIANKEDYHIDYTRQNIKTLKSNSI